MISLRFGSRSDMTSAATRGALAGGAFAATLGIAMLVRGPAVFAGYRFSFWFVVLFTAGTGLLAGVLVGVLKPLAASLQGAILVGAIAGALAFSALLFVVSGTTDHFWSAGVVAGALLGAGAGSMFWTDPSTRPPA